MENHPIPQDVTGFKFKLIGSITLKQFGYIFGAGVACLILYLIPMSPFIKGPLMGLFVAVGLALAFVPIEGRPIDTMAMHFVKALTANTQFVYRKKGVNLASYEVFRPLKVEQSHKTTQTSASDDSKRKELASALRNSYFRPDTEEMAFLKNVKSVFDNNASPLANQQRAIPQASHNPAAQPVRPTAEVAQPVVKTAVQADVVVKPVQLPKEPQVPTPAPKPPSEPIPNVEAQLKALQGEPQEQSSAQPQAEVAQPAAPAIPVPPAQPIQAQKLENATATKLVKDKNLQYSAGFPILPDKPNVVIGVVKDPRGKVLQNILVEVLDKNDIPVRAFKTNSLGQFASATPLPNGTYKILFDDSQKKNEFESIEVTLEGKDIFQPLEVVSVDQREKLRRELFGGTSAASVTPVSA